MAISSASNIYSALTASKKGVGGLVSGLDTDALVEALTLNTRTKISKQQQKKTTLQWQQTAYRSTATTLRNFQNKFFSFSVDGGKNNLASSAFYNTYKGTASNSSVKVTTSTSSVPGKIEVSQVVAKATNKTYTTQAYTTELLGDEIDLPANFTGKTMTVSLENSSRVIKLDDLNNKNETQIEAALQTLLDKAFGKNAAGTASLVTATVTSSGSGKAQIKLDAGANTVTAGSGTEILGFDEGTANRINSATKLKDIFGADLKGIGLNNDNLSFKINGKTIQVKASGTMGDLSTAINNAGAEVRLTFDSVSQTFTLTANNAGAGNTLDVEDLSGNMMNKLLGVAGGQVLMSSTSSAVEYGFNNNVKGTAQLTDYTTAVAYVESFLTSGGTADGTSAIRLTYDGVDHDITFTIEKSKLDTIKADAQANALSKMGLTNMSEVTAANQAEYDALYEGSVKTEYMKYFGNQVFNAVKAEDANAKVQFYMNEDGEMGFKTTSTTDNPFELKFEVSSLVGADTDLFAQMGYSGSTKSSYDPVTAKKVGDLGLTGSGQFNVTIGTVPKSISWSDSMTMYDFLNAVNGPSGFNEEVMKIVDGTLVLNEGNLKSLKVDDISGQFMETVFGTGSYESAAAVSGISTVKEGVNSEIKIGTETLYGNSNKFTVNGTTFDITDIADSDMAAGFTIDVVSDSTELVDKIQGFIDEYNVLVEAINSMIYEDKVSGYDPLTEEQRAEMSDAEITKWETEAKKGLLRNDPALRSLLAKMRETIYTKVEKAGLAPYDIGITTGSLTDRVTGSDSLDLKQSGKLYLEKDKLTAALEQNGDAVRMMFTNTEEVTEIVDGKVVIVEHLGLAHQLNKVIENAVSTKPDYPKEGIYQRGSLVRIAGYELLTGDNSSTITSKIDAIDKAISTLKMRLENEYNRYWKKFSALETAIAKMSAQSSWLTENAS